MSRSDVVRVAICDHDTGSTYLLTCPPTYVCWKCGAHFGSPRIDRVNRARILGPDVETTDRSLALHSAEVREDLMDECTLTLSLTSKEKAMLERLLKTGLYGRSLAEAAERVIANGLEEQLRVGILDAVEEDGDANR